MRGVLILAHGSRVEADKENNQRSSRHGKKQNIRHAYPDCIHGVL